MTAPQSPTERETPAGEAMREAVAYLTPHALTNGPIVLQAPLVRDAINVIASELARLTAERDEARAKADKAERDTRDLHQQNEKLTSGCPWEGPASEAAKYQPSDPCPVCGDIGEVSNDEPSRCVAYASGRQNYTLASAEAALISLRAEHAAEVARLATIETPRPISEYHEDMGFCLWWILPVCELPYSGSPLCDDWPDYHTHFTSLPEIRDAAWRDAAVANPEMGCLVPAAIIETEPDWGLVYGGGTET